MTITAIQHGRWDDPNTWDVGQVPTFGDEVILNGFSVEFDGTEVECDLIKNPQAGQLTYNGNDGQIDIRAALEIYGSIITDVFRTPDPANSPLQNGVDVCIEGEVNIYGCNADFYPFRFYLQNLNIEGNLNIDTHNGDALFQCIDNQSGFVFSCSWIDAHSNAYFFKFSQAMVEHTETDNCVVLFSNDTNQVFNTNTVVEVEKYVYEGKCKGDNILAISKKVSEMSEKINRLFLATYSNGSSDDGSNGDNARNFESISNAIKAAFMAEPDLQAAYGFAANDNFDEIFSAVSIEACLIHAVAMSMISTETLCKNYFEDLHTLVRTERYGSLAWYAERAKEFQFGHSLDANGQYANIDEDSKIVKYAVAEEYLGIVQMKIAKQKDNKPQPLDATELQAATAYLNRIKPAGIRLDVQSNLANPIFISLRIKYDATILNANGESLLSGEKVIENAVVDYLNNLEYNGAFVKMGLIDKVQQVSGVLIAEVDSVKVLQNSLIVDITEEISYTPPSGCFSLNANTNDGLTLTMES